MLIDPFPHVRRCRGRGKVSAEDGSCSVEWQCSLRQWDAIRFIHPCDSVGIGVRDRVRRSRRCSRRDRRRPPLPHHPSSAVNGATHTARERECAPPCVSERVWETEVLEEGQPRRGRARAAVGGGSGKSHSALHHINSASTPQSAHRRASSPHHSLLSSHAHR